MLINVFRPLGSLFRDIVQSEASVEHVVVAGLCSNRHKKLGLGRNCQATTGLGLLFTG